MEDYQKKSQTTDISETTDDKPVKLRTKKRGIGQKFKDTFIKGDIEEVTAGIISEFLIPYILNGVTDMCHSFIDGMFNGEGAGYYSGGYTNYAKRKKKSNSSSGGGVKRTNGSKKTRQLDDVLFDSQRDAKMVLKLMQEALEDGHHDSVSLTDFYDFYEEVTGDTIAHDSPEARWGWYDLEGVNVLRTRDEDGGIAYYIKLPKAEYLG